MEPYQYFCPMCGYEEEPNLPPADSICGSCLIPLQKRLLKELEKSDETARMRLLEKLDHLTDDTGLPEVEEEFDGESTEPGTE